VLGIQLKLFSMEIVLQQRGTKKLTTSYRDCVKKSR
jgi:hypothetical protein